MVDEKLKKNRFTWVRMGDNGPVIRWGPVGLVIAGNLLCYLIAQAILYLVLQVPFRLGIVSAVFSVNLAFLATVIELQRQNLKNSKFTFRFDLTYLFVVKLLAAMFFGSITAEVRASQRGFQRNLEIKTELEKLIGGGDIYLGGQNGKQITCLVKRKDFSDSDLANLIQASRGVDSGVCEITMLAIEDTAVSDSGLKELSACPKLEILALPPILLSDATLETLSTFRNLNYLTFDQKKITESQLNRLSEKLPNTKINGISYRDKQADSRK